MAILSVLVVYNSRIQDSKTAKSLLRAYTSKPETFESFKLVIYDNSPDSQAVPPGIPFECEYKHDPDNGGLTAAYNHALDRAVAGNYDWLLLFDDDSCLPVDFVEKFNDISGMVDSNVVAIVPKSHYRGRYFSPYKVLFGGIHRPVDGNLTGICDFEISAVGSAIMLRTSFMQDLGGFNRTFWLDCLDSWVFNVIHSSGKKVYVTDSIVEHELSILDYDKFMTEDKCRNILKYEAIFMKSFKTRLENYFYLIRLLKRSLTLLFTVKNKKYAKMTFEHLISLIFCSPQGEETVEGK